MTTRPLLLAALLALATGAALAQPPPRIDGTSAATAEASYERMFKGLDARSREALAIAVFKLNMTGVKSAHDVVANPELQKPGIARIRDRVDGMTAEEIIAAGDAVGGVSVKRK